MWAVYTGPVSTWWEYVSRVTGDQKPARIAEQITERGLGKVAVSTVNDWKRIKPKWQNVLAFAEAYEVSKQEALCAAYLDGEEVDLEAMAAAMPNRIIGSEAFKRLGGGQLATSIQTPGESS